MTCVECDSLQDRTDIKVPLVYVRVGTANVAIIGCPSHIKALLEIYNRGLKALEKTL